MGKQLAAGLWCGMDVGRRVAHVHPVPLLTEDESDRMDG